MTKARPRPQAQGMRPREMAVYGLIAGAVWVAWEITKQPLLLRAPPALAIQLAPNSPEVLRRLAEQRLAAKDTRAALALADASLSAAPFNARALRVRGLAAAEQGRDDDADQLLTLAGNWSLRDDPTHAYLVEQRLRRGDYNSAFAHADTLVRRRPELQPRIFNLFTTAAAIDTRSLPALVGLVAADPPWRSAFLQYLDERPEGDALLLSLAVYLQQTRKPLTDSELRRIFQKWLGEGRLTAMHLLREKIHRPSLEVLVQNGDFALAEERQLLPFDWQLGTGPGLSSEIVKDDLKYENRALRIAYDGFGSHPPAYQLLMLPPGQYILSGDERLELSPDNSRLRWVVSCFGDDRPIGRSELQQSGEPETWKHFTVRFAVPAGSCSAQWLRLAPEGGDRRVTIVTWFDNFKLVRVVSGSRPTTSQASRQ